MNIQVRFLGVQQRALVTGGPRNRATESAAAAAAAATAAPPSDPRIVPENDTALASPAMPAITMVGGK